MYLDIHKPTRCPTLSPNIQWKYINVYLTTGKGSNVQVLNQHIWIIHKKIHWVYCHRNIIIFQIKLLVNILFSHIQILIHFYLIIMYKFWNLFHFILHNLSHIVMLLSFGKFIGNAIIIVNLLIFPESFWKLVI